MGFLITANWTFSKLHVLKFLVVPEDVLSLNGAMFAEIWIIVKKIIEHTVNENGDLFS